MNCLPPVIARSGHGVRLRLDRGSLSVHNGFVQAHTFHPAEFTIRSDGLCKLNQKWRGTWSKSR